jgi:hypothetical protein
MEMAVRVATGWSGSSFGGIDKPLYFFDWLQSRTERWFPLFLELL